MYTCEAKHFKESECQTDWGSHEAHLEYLGCNPGAILLGKTHSDGNELKSLTWAWMGPAGLCSQWLLSGCITWSYISISVCFFQFKFYQISTHPWFQSAQTFLSPIFDIKHGSCRSLPCVMCKFDHILNLVTDKNSNQPVREATITSTGTNLIE